MNALMSTPRTEPFEKSCSEHELRIALILPSLVIGGSQQVVCATARTFSRMGCKAVVGVLFEGGPVEQQLKDQGTPFEVFSLSRRPFRKLPYYLSDMRRLCQRLREFFVRHRINVIQTNSIGPQDFFVLAVARQLGIPVVTFNFHDERLFLPDRANHVLSRVQRRLYHHCRRWVSDYVAVSPETKASLVRQARLMETQVTTICNGIDVEQFQRGDSSHDVRRELGLDPDAKLLITTAMMKEQKGHRFLIEAARQITSEEPRSHLLFVGDGHLRSDLERQVRELKLTEHIHFLGSRHDVRELLLESDIFVLPSLFEGLSIALLEAMAAGVPVVATAVSGTTTVVDSDRYALLVPPEDPDALARAVLNTLAKSPEELRAQCEAARGRVIEAFSLERQATDFVALYDRLLRQELANRKVRLEKVKK